jgi:enoyl-CoA hydratase/carnithine racemase
MPPAYEFTHLTVEIDAGGIALVTFGPQDEGELEDSIFANTRDVFTPLGLDPAVRAVVLTGRDDVFFGGAGRVRTRKIVNAPVELVAGQFQTIQQLVSAMVSFRKPLVAAINGKARNIGAQVGLLCDAAIACPGTTFFDDHIRAGIPAGDGGTMLWPLLLGMARAREILLLGRELSAEEALALDLVSKVVAPDQVVPDSVALARELADLPRMAYFATKLALNNWWRLSAMLSWDLAAAYEAAGLVEPSFAAKLSG